MAWTRLRLGGLPIDNVTRQRALQIIDALIYAKRGGFVATPNVDHIVLARTTPVLREAYGKARLSLPDGKPLLWMARALGNPLPEKVSGSDLLEPLMAQAAAKGHRVFLFGASATTSALAAQRLVTRHPGLNIVGRDTSVWTIDAGSDADELVVERIRRTSPDLVVVALGSPKQEVFMARFEKDLAPAVLVGLGASLDFAAGAVKRAPAWMSDAGLEWFYRLLQEPTRLAYRYLVRDLVIIPIFAADVVRRITRGPVSVRLDTTVPEEA